MVGGKTLSSAIATFLACTALALSATPSVSAKSTGLSGKTEIRTVKVLRPTSGAERGSLLVWVRVDHATLTKAANAAARRSRASHTGTVTVRVERAGESTKLRARQALERVQRPGIKRLEHGYRLRIPRRTAKRLGMTAAARAAARDGMRGKPSMGLEIQASQRLDLDRDGDPEAIRSDAAVRNVRPTAVEQTVSPNDGGFYIVTNFDLTIWVQADVVNYIDGNWGSCGFDGPTNAPIDPEDGSFSATATTRDRNPYVPGVPTVVNGYFTSSESATITNGYAESPGCSGRFDFPSGTVLGWAP